MATSSREAHMKSQQLFPFWKWWEHDSVPTDLSVTELHEGPTLAYDYPVSGQMTLKYKLYFSAPDQKG